MSQQTADSRYYYFDFLRVFAALAVMIIHVASRGWHTDIAALGWYATGLHSFEWQVFNFWHGSIVRWAVPVFTMISGALFLSRDIPIKKIYGKYIFRIFTAFLFWSFFYACLHYRANGDAVKALGNFLKGSGHLWFLSAIIGLYMSQPFLKKVAESKVLTKYFLALAFVFTFLLPEAANIITVFSEKYGNFAVKLIENYRPGIVARLAGYFLLGYFLNNSRISPKAKRLIYILGIIGFLWGQLLSVMASLITGEPNEVFYAHISLCRLSEAAAVFIFFKAKFNRPVKFIRPLAKYTFGVYLIHPAVINLVEKFGLNPLTFNPLFSIPVISVIVFVISFGISAILNHIPVLKKYIV